MVLKSNSVPKWVIITAKTILFLEIFLCILYIYPEFARPFIPLPIFLTIKQVVLLIICIVFLLFVPTAIFSNMRFSLFIAVFALVFVSAGGVFDRKSGISSNEHLWDSVQVGNSRYNLVQIIPRGDPSSPCYLYKCDVNDLACEEISSYVGNCLNSRNFDLVLNPITNEVNVLMDHEWSNRLILDFTYGDQPRTYLHILEVANFDYYLAYFHDVSLSMFKFMLYKCQKDTVDCSRLPFQYETHKFSYGYLELDEQSSEIKVLIENKLIYTYGKVPKCYVKDCLITDK